MWRAAVQPSTTGGRYRSRGTHLAVLAALSECALHSGGESARGGVTAAVGALLRQHTHTHEKN